MTLGIASASPASDAGIGVAFVVPLASADLLLEEGVLANGDFVLIDVVGRQGDAMGRAFRRLTVVRVP